MTNLGKWQQNHKKEGNSNKKSLNKGSLKIKWRRNNLNHRQRQIQAMINKVLVYKMIWLKWISKALNNLEHKRRMMKVQRAILADPLQASVRARLMSRVSKKVPTKEERSFQHQVSQKMTVKVMERGQDISKYPTRPASSEALAMSTLTLQISWLPRKNNMLNSTSRKLIKSPMQS